jgi:small-conductance mechanosensitive channel
MTDINYPRVAIGGLAAGVVANVCDFITNNFLIADDMQRMVVRLNLDRNAVASTSVGITWMVVDFIYALLIVWTYAAIRPRLGPGKYTAIAAGMVPYLSSTAVLFGFHAMGIFAADAFMKSVALSFITTVLASLTGGYLYKENEA